MARPRKPPRMDRREENGVWEVIYFCPKANRTVHRSLGVTDEAKARERFADWLIRFDPDAIDKEAVTVNDVLSFYMDFVERECLAKINVRSATKMLRGHFGPMPAKDVGAADVRAYVAKRRDDGLKDASIRAELSKLKAAYSHAAKQGFGGINFVPVFQLPSGSNPKEDFIDQETMQLLLDKLVERRVDGKISDIEAFITLAFRTAARKGAILDLTWDRVRFDMNKIDYRTPEWNALPMKHKSKRRAVVPMSAKMRAFMEQLRLERNPQPADRVVAFSHSGLYRELDKVIVDVGIKVMPHLLRRTFGSIASMSGKSTKEISRIMGNTERVAEARYIRFNPDYLKDAVEID